MLTSNMTDAVVLQGFFLGTSLILAIGAQSTFVLRKGLRGEHVALICFTCAFSDTLLISAGVAGFGTIIVLFPWIDPVFRLAGVAFLVVYGSRALLSARRGTAQALEPSIRVAPSWQSALATCLAFTWLNPHVYLDTVILLGSVSSRYEGQKLSFALGAIVASFTFFFALGYGAKRVQPLFANPVAWRILDIFIGVVMYFLAAGLVIAF